MRNICIGNIEKKDTHHAPDVLVPQVCVTEKQRERQTNRQIDRQAEFLCVFIDMLVLGNIGSLLPSTRTKEDRDGNIRFRAR